MGEPVDARKSADIAVATIVDVPNCRISASAPGAQTTFRREDRSGAGMGAVPASRFWVLNWGHFAIL